MSGFHHLPVLPEQTMGRMITDTSQTAVYVDGTLGGGGHAEMTLSRTEARLVGIDRDPNALAAATTRLAGFGDRFTALRGNFSDMPGLLQQAGIEGGVTGILLDLGVSSHQLDEPSRGFSYQHDAALDMRMDPDQALSAYNVINDYDIEDLTRVLREYGEERHAFRIAKAIIAARPVISTAQLAEIVMAAMPGHSKKGGPHPARRTFMGVRIEVNAELDGLRDSLLSAFNCLRASGRLCVITFHSLEDRIVKEFIRNLVNPCDCPPKIPMCICGKKPRGIDVARGGMVATDDEIEGNPRARSARLRAVERLAEDIR